MIEKLLYAAEKLLTGVLLTAATLGLFLVGCMAANVWYRQLSSREMTLLALGCMALTYILYCAMLRIRYERLCILADALEGETEETKALCEHLGVQ